MWKSQNDEDIDIISISSRYHLSWGNHNLLSCRYRQDTLSYAWRCRYRNDIESSLSISTISTSSGNHNLWSCRYRIDIDSALSISTISVTNFVLCIEEYDIVLMSIQHFVFFFKMSISDRYRFKIVDIGDIDKSLWLMFLRRRYRIDIDSTLPISTISTKNLVFCLNVDIGSISIQHCRYRRYRQNNLAYV